MKFNSQTPEGLLNPFQGPSRGRTQDEEEWVRVCSKLEERILRLEEEVARLRESLRAQENEKSFEIEAPPISKAIQRSGSDQDDYSGIIRLLVDIVDANDFDRVYRESGRVAEVIMESAGGENEKTAKLMHAVMFRMLSRYCEDPTELKSIAERFHINVNFLDDAIMVEMWLCNFLDFIYKHRFIERYSSIRSVFEFIDGHIKEYINMVTIVGHCHLSQQYLLRLFKERMGMSALDYIQTRKMLLAKWYLYFEEYSTMSVASKLGYGDVGYFSKVFKKYEGITPHQYKISVRRGSKET